jgi:hypothetical protein
VREKVGEGERKVEGRGGRVEPVEEWSSGYGGGSKPSSMLSTPVAAASSVEVVQVEVKLIRGFSGLYETPSASSSNNVPLGPGKRLLLRGQSQRVDNGRSF